MKKTFKIATIITLIVNVICFVVNIICAYTINTIPFGISYSGGDCSGRAGFGVDVFTTYPLTTYEGVVKSTTKVSFNISSLLISLVIIFVISFIIVLIINKIKNKSNK